MVDIDVADRGVPTDGDEAATGVLQDAIDDCAAAGGGTVRLPAGEYLSAPLFLRDDVRVHLESGATLQASRDLDAYPGVEGRWEGVEREVYASLFTGHDLENVAITGRGTLEGAGETWWAAYREDEAEHDLGRDRPYPGRLDYPRPRVVNLYDCTDVLVRDVTIRNSPAWTIHPVYCENVAVESVTIENPESSVNTDGINPDSCRNVRIANCHLDVGDDCVTVKSGYDADGRRVGEPCENVVVTNCTMHHGHGGVVIGSEMSGDVSNVAVSNCVFDGTDRGLRIKTARGRGGVVEDVRASNVVMRDITYSAFTLSMHYHGDPTEAQPVTEETPRLRGIHYADVTVTSCDEAMNCEGLPEMPVRDVSLSNVSVGAARRGLDVEHAEDVRFESVTVDALESPALDAAAVTGLDVDSLRDPDPDPETPVLRFRDVDDALVSSCNAAAGTGTFLAADGASENVTLSGNHLARAETERTALD